MDISRLWQVAYSLWLVKNSTFTNFIDALSYPIYKYHLGTPIAARRSSATVLGKAYAVGDIARRIQRASTSVIYPLKWKGLNRTYNY